MRCRRDRTTIVDLVCRRLRFMILHVVPEAITQKVGSAIADMLADQPVDSFTVDNGTEFAGHRHSADDDDSMFFADPYCAYPRGSNEYVNSLIRQHVPKGTGFSLVVSLARKSPGECRGGNRAGSSVSRSRCAYGPAWWRACSPSCPVGASIVGCAV